MSLDIITSLTIQSNREVPIYVGSRKLLPTESFSIQYKIAFDFAKELRYLYNKQVINIPQGIETIQPVWDELDKLNDPKKVDIVDAETSNKESVVISKEPVKETIVKEDTEPTIEDTAKDNVEDKVESTIEDTTKDNVEDKVEPTTEDTSKAATTKTTKKVTKSK